MVPRKACDEESFNKDIFMATPKHPPEDFWSKWSITLCQGFEICYTCKTNSKGEFLGAELSFYEKTLSIFETQEISGAAHVRAMVCQQVFAVTSLTGSGGSQIPGVAYPPNFLPLCCILGVVGYTHSKLEM